MTQAAKRQPSFGTRIKQLKDGEKDLYSMARSEIGAAGRISQGISTAGSGGINIGITFGGGPSIGNFLMTAGDTMVGPIAYFGDNSEIPLVTDTLNVGVETDGYHSRVVVAAEAGTADDLSTIAGAFWSGQVLNIQAKDTDTITIKHLVGNIRLDTAADFALGPESNILLVFDSIGNEWTNQHPLVSGAGGAGANRNLDNLLAPTLISVDLLPVAGDTYDLGDGVTDWKELFINSIRLQALGVGVVGARQLYGDATGVTLNIPTATNFFLDVNNVPIYDFNITRSIHPSIIIGGGLNQLNINAATAPGAPVDGQFWHDSADNHLYARTGSTTVDLTDIGTGAAGANIQLSNLDLGLVRINTDLEPVTAVADHNLGTAARYWQNLEVQRVRFQENNPPTGSTFIQGRADFSGQDDMYFNVPLNSGFRFLEAGSGGTLVFIDPVTNRVRFEEEINRLDIEGDSSGAFVWSLIAPGGAAANASYSLLGTTGGHLFLNPVKFGNTGIVIEDDGDADFNAKEILDIGNITMAANGDLLNARNVEADKFQYVNNPSVIFLELTAGGIDYNAGVGDFHNIKLGGVTIAQFVDGGTTFFEPIVVNGPVTISGISDAFLDMSDIPEPASPVGGQGRIFLDNAIAPGILKIKHSDGSVISLEGAGGGSQTPWLTTINAAQNDLINIKNIEGRDTGATGSFRIIFDANEDSDTWIGDDFSTDSFIGVANGLTIWQTKSDGFHMIKDLFVDFNFTEFAEITDPSIPSTNRGRVWLDTDGILKIRHDNGSVVSLEQGGAGGGADLDLGNLTPTNINQNLRPSSTGANRDLGEPGRQWRDLYMSGQVNCDSVVATSGVSSFDSLLANTFFQSNGNAQFNGSFTTFGNSSVDDVIFVAEISSNMIPDGTNAFDLGSAAKQWRNLFITGLIDTDALFVSGFSNFNDVAIADDIEINGDLNHDGPRVGFYGTTPQSRSSGWFVSGSVDDRTLSQSTGSVTEVAEVLGTLIRQLERIGLLI